MRHKEVEINYTLLIYYRAAERQLFLFILTGVLPLILIYYSTLVFGRPGMQNERNWQINSI